MGPLSWSAIAAGSAALAKSLGLGAAATGLIVGNKNKNIDEFKDWAKTQYPIPETKVNIPSAENALVLRPEYRTVTTPVEYIGYRPLFNNADPVIIEDDYTPANLLNVREHNTTPSPKPNDEKPKEDKGFKKGLKKGWEHTKKVGNIGLQGIGIGLGLSPIVGVPAGVYYGGKALGWWGEDSNDSSNEIDREGTEQAWEDMKVGRKPGQ